MVVAFNAGFSGEGRWLIASSTPAEVWGCASGILCAMKKATYVNLSCSLMDEVRCRLMFSTSSSSVRLKFRIFLKYTWMEYPTPGSTDVLQRAES